MGLKRDFIENYLVFMLDFIAVDSSYHFYIRVMQEITSLDNYYTFISTIFNSTFESWNCKLILNLKDF